MLFVTLQKGIWLKTSETEEDKQHWLHNRTRIRQQSGTRPDTRKSSRPSLNELVKESKNPEAPKIKDEIDNVRKERAKRSPR